MKYSELPMVQNVVFRLSEMDAQIIFINGKEPESTIFQKAESLIQEMAAKIDELKAHPPLPCSQCSDDAREHAGQQCWDQPCAELHDWISNQLPPYSPQDPEA